MDRLKRVEYLVAGITTKCNAKCRFCARTEGWSINKKLFDLDLDLIIGPLLPRLQKISLVGSLGDPMFNSGLLSFLKRCAKEYPNIEFEIWTNGSMHDKEFWSELGSLNKEKITITFSIDGLEDTHSIHRHVDFNTVIQNLKTYINSGGAANWQFILFDYNFHQMDEAATLAKSLGCKEFNAIRSTVYNSEFKAPNEIKSRNEIFESLATGRVDCYWRNGNKIYINEFGEVHPCCHIAPYFNTTGYEDILEIYLKNKHLINLYNYDLDTVMKNEYLKFVFKNTKSIEHCNKTCGFSRLMRTYISSVKHYIF